MSQAVRDMDFMKERATLNPGEDPFKMMSSRAVERSIMETVGLIPRDLIPAGELPNALDHEEPALHMNSRVKAKKEEAREQNPRRLGMAAIGGLLLLVPVLIMANLPGKLATLVTTSASLAVFAVLITLATDLGLNEVLATTAGYAAVLVVSVGTSLAPQAGNSSMAPRATPTPIPALAPVERPVPLLVAATVVDAKPMGVVTVTVGTAVDEVAPLE
ncbi:hypothetical protein LTR49_017463 [Elasticomyces elasticus]|nr:hypothetical protein LTR49_017463 [Elasticomyces elasticus]